MTPSRPAFQRENRTPRWAAIAKVAMGIEPLVGKLDELDDVIEADVVRGNGAAQYRRPFARAVIERRKSDRGLRHAGPGASRAQMTGRLRPARTTTRRRGVASHKSPRYGPGHAHSDPPIGNAFVREDSCATHQLCPSEMARGRACLSARHSCLPGGTASLASRGAVA